MHKELIAVASPFLSIISSTVIAAGCSTMEYAQYKDQANTDIGRQMMASRYCATKKVIAIQQEYLLKQTNIAGEMNLLNARAGRSETQKNYDRSRGEAASKQIEQDIDQCIAEMGKMGDAIVAAESRLPAKKPRTDLSCKE